MPSIFHNSFNDIISLDNLLLAWQEFVAGKKKKKDVQIFERDLLDNIIALHEDLKNKIYQHGGYEDFYVNDPKRRHIHKASVRDRLLHHAVYRQLYPFFDKTFIADSFSCRKNKGTYNALDRFTAMAYQVSKNYTKTCWILKCDIKQFFASIDHQILLNILKEHIPDQDILNLLEKIIDSYCSCHPRLDRGSMDSRVRGNDRGLPLGNLTSQLFANVYMNVFDQWIKHKLKDRYYIRYADDFIMLSQDKEWLKNAVSQIRGFLLRRLRLTLHPSKIFLKTHASGMDFLGWVLFPDYKKLRAKTKQRMFRRLLNKPQPEVLQSYLGLLTHGDTFKVESELRNVYWLFSDY